MKKFLFSLLLLFGGCAAASAQSYDRIKTEIFNYLSDDCGYETLYDEDNDIQFTMDDLVYYAIVKTVDEGYSLVEFRVAFEAENPVGTLLRIANDFNLSHYLGKCTVDSGRFQISMEFAAETTAQALFQTRQALHWFPTWIDTLSQKFEELSEN